MTAPGGEPTLSEVAGDGDPIRFLTAFAQALSTMALYGEQHPARQRAIDAAYEQLLHLQRDDPRPSFSFLDAEVVYGQQTLRDLRSWDWAGRLAGIGVQRLEFTEGVERDEFEAFLDDVLARMSGLPIDTSEARQMRRTAIRFGAIGIRGDRALTESPELPIAVATVSYALAEEAETVRWMHEEVGARATLPMVEAEAVVRSLSVAMHGESRIVIPLLQLKDFDQYTTTHSINVAVLAMALGEFLGLGPRDVRDLGVAGLLHDLGKVSIPKDILNKPGKLSEEERQVMNRHPVEGARLILDSAERLDMAAAVAYEHHIMLNGGGYPALHYRRGCHAASNLVHVCDVYDALRTRRPYRDAWESERVLGYLDERSGLEFDPHVARTFAAMIRQWDRRVVRLTQTGETEPAAGPRPPTGEPG